jgi:dipeptidyl aminopeptidase/acylaminoacyl peptidase
VQQQAGQPGLLEQADGESIGLWGHSMGGGITQRVLVVDGTRGGAEGSAVDAAVLYGSMSGDEMLNHERILNVFSGGTRGNWDEGEEPTAEELARIAPISHLDAIAAPVSIHHGDLDDQVPLEWSNDLCALLQEAGKTVECWVYEGQPHTFVGEGDTLFIQRTVDFFDRTLRN